MGNNQTMKVTPRLDDDDSRPFDTKASAKYSDKPTNESSPGSPSNVYSLFHHETPSPSDKILAHSSSPGSSRRASWSFAGQRWGEAEDSKKYQVDDLYQALWPWYRVMLIGVGVGLVEFIPVISLATLVQFRFDTLDDVLYSHGIGPMIGVNLTFAVVLTATASLMVIYVAHLAGGNGLPGIISYLSSGYIPHREMLSVHTIFVKIVTIVMVIGGGTVVGREEPAIHIGTGTADILFRLIDHHAPPGLKLVKKDHSGEIFDGESAHEVAILGACAGFATAFGAPIGGMLYVWEEISTHWDNLRHTSLGARCFFGMAVSTLVLRSLVAIASNSYYISFNSIIIFDPNDDALKEGTGTWEYADLPAIITLGICCGLLAGYGAKVAREIHHFNKKTPFMTSPAIKVFYVSVVACLTAVLFSFVPLWLSNCKVVEDDGYDDNHRRLGGGGGGRRYVQYNCPYGYYNELASLTMVGTEGLLRHLMARDEAIISIAALTVFLCVYIPMALLPFGSAIPAGTSVPNLLIGAAVGRLWGEVVYLIKDSTRPGVYAVIGAGAMLGGWTRTMMAIVVTIAEVTGDVSLSIPLIIAVSLSRQLASYISHHSYTHSMVDHLEDENNIKPPNKWFDSRNAKRRKTYHQGSLKKVMKMKDLQIRIGAETTEDALTNQKNVASGLSSEKLELHDAESDNDSLDTKRKRPIPQSYDNESPPSSASTATSKQSSSSSSWQFPSALSRMSTIRRSISGGQLSGLGIIGGLDNAGGEGVEGDLGASLRSQSPFDIAQEDEIEFIVPDINSSSSNSIRSSSSSGGGISKSSKNNIDSHDSLRAGENPASPVGAVTSDTWVQGSQRPTIVIDGSVTYSNNIVHDSGQSSPDSDGQSSLIDFPTVSSSSNLLAASLHSSSPTTLGNPRYRTAKGASSNGVGGSSVGGANTRVRMRAVAGGDHVSDNDNGSADGSGNNTSSQKDDGTGGAGVFGKMRKSVKSMLQSVGLVLEKRNKHVLMRRRSQTVIEIEDDLT